MEYALEINDLVKRYPTSASRRKGFFFIHGGIRSFSGIFSLLKGVKGPFIEALRGVNIRVKK